MVVEFQRRGTPVVVSVGTVVPMFIPFLKLFFAVVTDFALKALAFFAFFALFALFAVAVFAAVTVMSAVMVARCGFCCRTGQQG